MERVDGRKLDELRPIKIIRDYTKYAEGSVLIEVGDTKVICTATIDEKLPNFKKGTGEGWITAEYSMLPRATQNRNIRSINRLRLDGRTSEIQRLIGRSMRSAINLSALGERTLIIDCDVIQADGGTRTAAITGAFVAVIDALYKIYKKGIIETFPINSFISAVSVGIVNGKPMLDLSYMEDSRAKVDMNIIMNDQNQFIEIQGTGEQAPFSKDEFKQLILLGELGTSKLIKKQKEVLKDIITELFCIDGNN